MGGVAMKAERIAREHVNPTLNKYKEILNQIPHIKYSVLGSAGKKPTSGDIDLGFFTYLSIDEISEYLLKLGINHKIGKGFDQIWTEFEQYDENGPIGKNVQIDLMLGNIDWLEFAYWAPSVEETEFTAHHRSALLAAIIRYCEEIKLQDSSIQTWVINWGSGLWTKKRVKYIISRGKNKGQEGEKQIKSKIPEITQPLGVPQLLSQTTNREWKLEELMQPFEVLWDYTVEAFNKEKLPLIAEYTANAINHRNGKSEEKLYIVPDVLRQYLKEESLF